MQPQKLRNRTTPVIRDVDVSFTEEDIQEFAVTTDNNDKVSVAWIVSNWTYYFCWIFNISRTLGDIINDNDVPTSSGDV